MSETPSSHDPHKPSPEAEEIARHVGSYVRIGLLSVVFTCATVAFSFITHGNVLVALILAACNAVMVACFTMHLKSEKGTNYRAVFLALFFTGVMFFASYLAYSDRIHR